MKIRLEIAAFSMLGAMVLQMVMGAVVAASAAAGAPIKEVLSSKLAQAAPVKLSLASLTLVLAIWAPLKLVLMSEAARALPSRFDLFAQVGWEGPVHFAFASRIASGFSFPDGVRSLYRRSQTMKRVTIGYLLVIVVCAGTLALATVVSVLAYPRQAHASAGPTKWIFSFDVGRDVDDTRVHEPSTTQEERNECITPRHRSARACCDALVAARPAHPPC